MHLNVEVIVKKLKSISKSYSKKIKFDEYYNCLFGRKYQQQCANYNIRSLNHEMYFQEQKKINIISLR